MTRFRVRRGHHLWCPLTFSPEKSFNDFREPSIVNLCLWQHSAEGSKECKLGLRYRDYTKAWRSAKQHETFVWTGERLLQVHIGYITSVADVLAFIFFWAEGCYTVLVDLLGFYCTGKLLYIVWSQDLYGQEADGSSEGSESARGLTSQALPSLLSQADRDYQIDAGLAEAPSPTNVNGLRKESFPVSERLQDAEPISPTDQVNFCDVRYSLTFT